MTGAIHCTSSPSGSSIWLDGVDTGYTTERYLVGIPDGEHYITFKMTGYLNCTSNVTVTNGVVSEATCILTPAPTGNTLTFNFYPIPSNAIKTGQHRRVDLNPNQTWGSIYTFNNYSHTFTFATVPSTARYEFRVFYNSPGCTQKTMTYTWLASEINATIGFGATLNCSTFSNLALTPTSPINGQNTTVTFTATNSSTTETTTSMPNAGLYVNDVKLQNISIPALSPNSHVDITTSFVCNYTGTIDVCIKSEDITPASLGITPSMVPPVIGVSFVGAFLYYLLKGK